MGAGVVQTPGPSKGIFLAAEPTEIRGGFDRLVSLLEGRRVLGARRSLAIEGGGSGIDVKVRTGSNRAHDRRCRPPHREASLDAWHDEQNPVVRGLSDLGVGTMAQALTQMQAIIDEPAREIGQHRGERATLRAEHVLAQQVKKGRIDQLERPACGRRPDDAR